jgi:hypothetical protein
MNGALGVALICASVWGLFLAVISMPRWFTRSLHGHRMWRLRDALADDLIDGHLPREHPAVQQLYSDVDFAVQNGKRWSMLDIYICRHAMRKMSPELREAVKSETATRPLDGLSADEVELLTQYQTRFGVLMAGSLLLGSWLGLATIARFIPRAISETLRQKRADLRERIRSSATYATDLAATQSRLGQESTALAAHRHALASVPGGTPEHSFLSFRS